jgi:hypothetical protein
MTVQPTAAQQFADEYARDLVPGMLRTIRNARRYSRVILVGAMATSYTHQALFLAHTGAGIFGWVLPLLFDTAMVYMLSIVKAPGMVRDAKRAAAMVFAAVALVSGFINAAAPGSAGMRALYAFVVLLVIGVEWVAGHIRPDFTAIEARAAAAPVPTARKLTPEVAAARAAKAKATRERNAQAKAAEQATPVRAPRTDRRPRQAGSPVQGELALMLDGYVPADAPVSPAPQTA